MAFKLDNDLLEELGLAALTPHEKQAMLRQILETLEMRVGTTLASRMTDAQLDEFEGLMPAEGDDHAVIQQKEQHALQWLESNFPNYKQVVNDELEKLKTEIKQSAPHIVAASQQASLGAVPQAVPMQAPAQTPLPPAPSPAPFPTDQPMPSFPQPQSSGPTPGYVQPDPYQQPAPGSVPPTQPYTPPASYNPPTPPPTDDQSSQTAQPPYNQ